MIQAEFFSIQTVNFGEFVHQEVYQKLGFNFQEQRTWFQFTTYQMRFSAQIVRKCTFKKLFKAVDEILTNIESYHPTNTKSPKNNCMSTWKTSKNFRFLKIFKNDKVVH